MRAFPPRLPEEPIFYPVLSEAYAATITRDWNVPASGRGSVTHFIIAKMGRPHQVLDGCGYYGRQIVGCAREYVYFPPWTIVDEAWAFSLNANGVVINTAHFVSP